MSNASTSVASLSWQPHDEELPTLIQGGKTPSLISIPKWPEQKRSMPRKASRANARRAKPRRVADVFPIQAAYATPAEHRQAPHELSPFGSSAQRIASSTISLVVAYALLGLSAFWATWSVAGAL